MWLLIVYYTPEKKSILKFMELNTIREVAYLIDMIPSHVSNTYHRLINPRGLMRYCNLYKIAK